MHEAGQTRRERRNWRTGRKRISYLDIVVVVFLLGAGLYLVYRVRLSLHYTWDWSGIPQYFFRNDPGEGWVSNLLTQGLLTTMRLSIWGGLLATIIGSFMGVLLVGQSLFRRLCARSYVELIRNIPPLVLIFIFYFFIGDQIINILGVDGLVKSAPETTRALITLLFAPPSRLSPFISAVTALAFLEGAYIAEIVRAGIQSIEKGQWEAARALGFTRWQQLRHIVFPQVLERILPPLAGQYISTIKDSAIVSVISIPELTFQGMEIMSATYLTFEIWITITLLYFLLTFALSLCGARLEAHMRKKHA
jgi:polar amino acid transport system permease protein